MDQIRPGRNAQSGPESFRDPLDFPMFFASAGQENRLPALFQTVLFRIS